MFWQLFFCDNYFRMALSFLKIAGEFSFTFFNPEAVRQLAYGFRS